MFDILLCHLPNLTKFKLRIKDLKKILYRKNEIVFCQKNIPLDLLKIYSYQIRLYYLENFTCAIASIPITTRKQ